MKAILEADEPFHVPYGLWYTLSETIVPIQTHIHTLTLLNLTVCVQRHDELGLAIQQSNSRPHRGLEMRSGGLTSLTMW